MTNGESFSDESVNYYYYLGMIKKAERIRAFESAIQATVHEDDVVVEIGSGLGTYSFFAARSGARRVYAIERERVSEVAEELAAKNGLADRIAFIRADSKETTLPIAREIVASYVSDGMKLPWYIDLLNINLNNTDLDESRRRIRLLADAFRQDGTRITGNLDFSTSVDHA